MTIPEMLSQSAILTFLGLGVVFSFLIILIGFMKLVESFVKISGIDKKDGNASTAASPAASVPAGQDSAVIAAIAAAVSEKQKN
ncbi:MAG: OadG family protein [Spirochaetales bacterium]|nr:OadG family protein [Spirochaetales bacterium]